MKKDTLSVVTEVVVVVVVVVVVEWILKSTRECVVVVSET
jgi:hypothetical protein